VELPSKNDNCSLCDCTQIGSGVGTRTLSLTLNLDVTLTIGCHLGQKVLERLEHSDKPKRTCQQEYSLATLSQNMLSRGGD
jgi:hypothetical protein